MTWMETGYVMFGMFFGVIAVLIAQKRYRDLARQREELMGAPIAYSDLPDAIYRSLGGCFGNGFLRLEDDQRFPPSLISVSDWPGGRFPEFDETIEKRVVTETRLTTLSGSVRIPPRERVA